jgi:integrase
VSIVDTDQYFLERSLSKMQVYHGSIQPRPRKNGKTSYQVVIELGRDPLTGERNRLSKTYTTKKEAEYQRTKMLNELNHRTYIGESNTVLKTYMDEWLEVFVKPYISPSTYEKYLSQINNHIYPALGRLKLQNIIASDIQKLYNTLNVKSPVSGKALAPKTIKNIHLNISACLDRAVKDDLIRKNPCKDVILPKRKKSPIKVYDRQETAKLLEVVRDTDMELVVNMLIGLGLRRGELLAVTWNDLDTTNGTLSINKNVIFVKGESIVKEPKAEAGVRVLTVPKILLDLLNKWRKNYIMNKFKHGADFHDTNLIICKPEGSPYHPDTITAKFDKLLKQNGLRHQRLHDLRHLNATLMLASNVSAKIAQQRLGHASYQITMDLYTHVLNDLEQDSADKIDNEINSILSLHNA